ncbi:carboxypeptidase Q isoform X2 [Fopius arisanus]|nr:PREDICTED: carboxypeptidase Q-like isoform X2 [Fopius arisanus]XP_011302056.1 PREDICTED: carboxypeptidase Q-like isoform X2 [Fopius arisanus]
MIKMMMMLMIQLVLIVAVLGWSQSSIIIEKTDSCESLLPVELINEIDNYQAVVNRIIDAVVNGSFKGRTWRELAGFVDDFGPRFTGTETLERSIDYVIDRSKTLGLENVHGEVAPVPRWIRGKESATLVSPRKKDLRMLGLGYSVGTPNEGITADAIIVESFAELKRRADEVAGKIVVYNQDFVSYGETVIYRSSGASEAAKYGALAVLIRSITPLSIYSPHTGMMSYEDNVRKIPAACITIEDAQMLGRLAARGKRLTIRLMMEAHQLADTESRNVIAELKGSTKINKTVVVSGHIDSWDVGQGAMDDGAGAFVSWNSLVLLKALNLRPKRTIRAIMWTAEEMGIVGADYYIKQHKHEEGDLQFVMESDYGTFTPLGLEANGRPEVICILRRIMKILSVMAPLEVTTPGTGPDIGGWINAGVPGASLLNKNERYFWFHHSDGDAMTVEDSGTLDMITALFAATSYILADISIDLPRQAPGN